MCDFASFKDYTDKQQKLSPLPIVIWGHVQIMLSPTVGGRCSLKLTLYYRMGGRLFDELTII